ncbi:hypothetical protein Bca101_083761 [Brassica carinata]
MFSNAKSRFKIIQHGNIISNVLDVVGVGWINLGKLNHSSKGYYERILQVCMRVC